VIEAVLFDLDDTLLDREACVEPFAKRLYVRHDLSRFPYEAYWECFKGLDKRGYGDKRSLFQTLVTRFALPASAGELEALFVQTAWKGCGEYLSSGAQEVLVLLRSQGYRVGIITNGSAELQRGKLVESGLASLVDVALVSAEEEVKKSAPEIFARAAERLAVTPAECVFVGDNPESDILGGNGVGMRTVWMKSSFFEPPEVVDAVAEDISDIPGIIERLSAQSVSRTDCGG